MLFLMYNSDYYEQLYKPDLFDVTLKSFFFRKTFLNKNVQENTYAEPYMQKTCDVAEMAILAKKNLRKKCVNRDKM